MKIVARIQLDSAGRINLSFVPFLKGIKKGDKISVCVEDGKLLLHKAGTEVYDDKLPKVTVDSKNRITIPKTIREMIKGLYLYAIIIDDDAFIIIRKTPIEIV